LGAPFWVCFLFGVPDQARLGLDVLPAHATWGSGGVTSDWLCMWWDGALDPGINIVASLCADVRFFGLAQRMERALAAGFLFLLGADWSGALVRPGFAGPWRLVLSQMAPSHIRWGRGRCARVMGAYSAACPQRLM
jgi:hypothetical protein